MLIGLAQRLHHMKFLLNEHSPTILTGVGVVGTVSTAYLTGRATVKAVKIIEENSKEYDLEYNPVINETFDVAHKVELSTSRKLRLVWKLYIPPVGMGATTISAIILANKISSKRIAALGVAAGLSERALQEYKDKVLEKIGERQNTAIHDEIAQDRVNQHPVNSREVILAGTGEVLCFDMSSGRYFQSTVEEIKRAENKINFNLVNFMHSSLSEFYDEIGLPPTSYSDTVGWNLNNKLEVRISAVLSTDNRPCLAIDFVKPPYTDYDKKAWDAP
jgi:Family of unknown function (DUF6353)